MRGEMELLLGLLDEGFDRKAWHGPNLRGALRGLTAVQAAWRPAPGRHNIWETAIHCAYWKYAVRRRLTGEKRGAFALKGSNWFERPVGRPSDAAWRDDVALLIAEHEKLRRSAEVFPARRLHRKPGGSRNSYLGLIRGIAAHDIYHAGQIQLLKRLQR